MILVCKYKEAGQWTHKEGSYFFFPLIETGGYEGMHWVSVWILFPCDSRQIAENQMYCLLFVVKDVACLFDSKPLNIDLVLNASV